MKFVTKTISLPEDIAAFAEKKVARIAKETQTAKNMSRFITGLVMQEKEKETEAAAQEKAA